MGVKGGVNGWKKDEKTSEKLKMLRFGPLRMGIGLSDVKLHGEFDGNGLRVVRAQKIGF